MLPLWAMIEPYLNLLLITFVPYIELRGSIPVGIGLGMDPLWVFIVCTVANVLIILPIFIFLDFAFERFFRIGWIHRHVKGKVDSVRNTAITRIDRYGLLGLAAFVAIPLPGTGAYTGCLAAYLLDLERKRSALAIGVGVFVAGILVTLASLGFFSAIKALKIGWAGGILVAVVCVVLIYIFWKSKIDTR